MSQIRAILFTVPPPDGYATTFTVTVFDPLKRWEFDMENSNIKGHWTGIFASKGEETEIDVEVS